MDLAETSKKKKRRQELPTIRFDLSLNRPSQDKFSEFNYNKIALKTYKLLKKKSTKLKKQLKRSKKEKQPADQQQVTVDAIRNLSITNGEYGNLDRRNEFKLDRARLDEMLSVYRKKLILSRRLDEKLEDDGDDDGQDNEGTYDDEEDGDGDASFNSRDEEDSRELDSNQGEPVNGKRGKSRTGSSMNDMYKFKLKNFDHLAEGYDEDDSFIDNTDAHDVNIPTNMVPTRGGFYVNKETITLKPKDKIKRPSGRTRASDEGEEASDVKRSDTSADSESLLEEEEESYDSDESDEDEDDGEDEDEEECASSHGDDKLISNGKMKSDQEQRVNANVIMDSNSSSNGSLSERAKQKAMKTKVKSSKMIQDDEDEVLDSAGNKNKENNQTMTMTTSSITSNPTPNSNGVIVVNKKRKNIDSQMSMSGEPGTVTITSKSLKHNVNAVSCENVNTFKKKKYDDSLIKVGDQSSVNDSSVNKNQILAESKLENSNKNPNKIKLNINENSSSSNDCIPIDSEDFADSIKNKKLTSQGIATSASPAPPVNRQQQTVSNQNVVAATTTNTSQPVNVNRTIPNQSIVSLPVNLPAELKLMVNNLVELFGKNATLNIEPFTEKFKMELVKIYLESNKQNLQDKSQIFHYISFKVNRSKENLFRMCRRLLNKESTNTAPKIPNTNQQQPFVNTKQTDQSSRTASQPQTSPSSSSSQPKPHQQQQPKTKPTVNVSNQVKPILNNIDLTEDMRLKLSNLKSHYEEYKRNNMVGQFFDSPVTAQLIYSLDCAARSNRLAPQLRDHFQVYLADVCELKLDALQRKYNQTVAHTRQTTLEANLKNKMDLLKKEIDAEMPKIADRYNRQLIEYRALCAAEAGGGGGEKKQQPRRNFDLTDRMRALITSIIQIKMSLYRSPMSTSPQCQSEQALKLDYMNRFFDNELLPLWPKNWMQRTVLTSIYQAKYGTVQQVPSQPVQPVGHQPSPRPGIGLSSPNRPPPTSTSTPTIINLSSKNGKSVTIEPQQLNQQQQLPQFKQQHNVYDLVVDTHRKQAPSPGPAQQQQPANTPVNKPQHSKANTSLNASLNLDEFYIQAAAVAAAATAAATKPLTSGGISSMQLSQALNFTLPNLMSNPTQASNILNSISKLNSGTNFSS